MNNPQDKVLKFNPTGLITFSMSGCRWCDWRLCPERGRKAKLKQERLLDSKRNGGKSLRVGDKQI